MRKEEGQDYLSPQEFLHTAGYSKEIYALALRCLISISILGILGVIAIIICAPQANYDGILTLASASVGGIVGIFASSNTNK